MSDVKLLPCPFCGGEPVLTKIITPEGYQPCVSCESMECPVGPCTDGFVSAEEASAAWNTRATDHARIVAEKDAEIQRLREALEKAYDLLVRTFPSDRPVHVAEMDKFFAVNRVIVAVMDALNPPQQKDGE